ncbi:LacI family DNA-binding transcriptional regulator [Glutamicibacter endophyticus]|uniref:LacI family DNA-binding transcriptional regulator n=1 Tax=Glutamicibacter endophyticus TaxID=1522174 RepID=UPI003AEFB57D
MTTEHRDAEPTNSRPPSMADVATVAGVSHQTVSRVLNDHPNVREDTRQRVLQAIEQMGYRRNRAARALATARTSTIGILTVGNSNFGPANTVLGIESAARAEGYFVSVSSLEASDAAGAQLALGHLVDQGVDGIIVVAPLAEVAQVVERASLNVPVVVVAANPLAEPTDALRYVCADQRFGARAVTEYLIELGHRQIAHVVGQENWIDAAERRTEWRKVLEEHAVQGREYRAEGWSAADGYAVGRQVADDIAAGQGPTAVFAANDYIALGLLRALWERGLQVPDDVSVVGFDDVESSAFYIPALTTVRQPFGALGKSAMSALSALSAGEPGGEGRFAATLEPELIVRASTAPPRAAKD